MFSLKSINNWPLSHPYILLTPQLLWDLRDAQCVCVLFCFCVFLLDFSLQKTISVSARLRESEAEKQVSGELILLLRLCVQLHVSTCVCFWGCKQTVVGCRGSGPTPPWGPPLPWHGHNVNHCPRSCPGADDTLEKGAPLTNPHSARAIVRTHTTILRPLRNRDKARSLWECDGAKRTMIQGAGDEFNALRMLW